MKVSPHARFMELATVVMSVPHAEIVRREREYKEKAALNPKKRGPKPEKRR